ncbi:MAG: hypothetical protein CG445_3, partial [Methanosaeta sp. ASM2]
MDPEELFLFLFGYDLYVIGRRSHAKCNSTSTAS